MAKKALTQSEKIVKYLKKSKHTASRLAGFLNTKENAVRARISDLRKAGQVIEKTMTRDGKTAYQLIQQ